MKLLAITLAVVFLVASTTSAYRTTITTVEIDDNQLSSQQCQQQIQRQSLNHCQQYVRQQSGGRYLAMRTNQYLNQQQQQHFEPCCQELRQLNEQCQCEALEQILQQQQQQGELRGQKLQKVAQQLQNLPQRCQSASRSCQIGGSGSWF